MTLDHYRVKKDVAFVFEHLMFKSVITDRDVQRMKERIGVQAHEEGAPMYYRTISDTTYEKNLALWEKCKALWRTNLICSKLHEQFHFPNMMQTYYVQEKVLFAADRDVFFRVYSTMETRWSLEDDVSRMIRSVESELKERCGYCVHGWKRHVLCADADKKAHALLFFENINFMVACKIFRDDKPESFMAAMMLKKDKECDVQAR